jgi:hypothetical protein
MIRNADIRHGLMVAQSSKARGAVAMRRILELGKTGEFFPTPLPHRVGQISLKVADANGAAPRKSRRSRQNHVP